MDILDGYFNLRFEEEPIIFLLFRRDDGTALLVSQGENFGEHVNVLCWYFGENIVGLGEEKVFLTSPDLLPIGVRAADESVDKLVFVHGVDDTGGELDVLGIRYAVSLGVKNRDELVNIGREIGRILSESDLLRGKHALHCLTDTQKL